MQRSPHPLLEQELRGHVTTPRQSYDPMLPHQDDPLLFLCTFLWTKASPKGQRLVQRDSSLLLFFYSFLWTRLPSRIKQIVGATFLASDSKESVLEKLVAFAKGTKQDVTQPIT
ncbi:hypothetical protein CR513_56069, partial [Mucuna pruriens]